MGTEAKEALIVFAIALLFIVGFITAGVIINKDNEIDKTACEVAKENKIEDIFNYVYEYEYKGHEYIFFKNNHTSGVVHNPDCKYCKNQE